MPFQGFYMESRKVSEGSRLQADGTLRSKRLYISGFTTRERGNMPPNTDPAPSQTLHRRRRTAKL